MGTVTGYTCAGCGRGFPPRPPAFTCPSCGPVGGTLDVSVALPRVCDRDDPHLESGGMWRFIDFLPVVSPGPAAALLVGGTPLYSLPRLASELGVAEVLLKDDSRNPSFSLKDRASAVAIAAAAEAGAHTIACASTGNAAASLSCLCAAASIRCIVFVPANAPRAKMAQALAHGASVFAVEGSYDDAFDLCARACSEFGWYPRNTATNPVLAEGKKTVAMEMAKQCGWNPPDAVFVPVGDGCILAGVHKGFSDLLAAGWIDRMPRLFGAQSRGSDACARAFHAGLRTPAAVEPSTIADSISVSLPKDGLKALRAARDTGGGFVAVSDDEILDAQSALARKCGVFAEPAASAALAAAVRAAAAHAIGSQDRIGILVTGSGLKDVDRALKRLAAPVPVGRDIADLRKSL